MVSSTGNTGTAYSSYLAAAGCTLYAFLPRFSSAFKEADIAGFGQNVFRVDGDYPTDQRVARDNQRLMKLGNRFAYRANLLWARSRIADYKAAWFEVLAAESYRGAENHKQSGGFFHFAAHTFRHVGEYALAGKYYLESAREYEKSGDESNSLRACQRGIACFEQVCDNTDPVYGELTRIRDAMAAIKTSS